MHSASHRRGLIRRAERQGLFRDPERLLERMVELEDLLWRAVGKGCPLSIPLCQRSSPRSRVCMAPSSPLRLGLALYTTSFCTKELFTKKRTRVCTKNALK